MSNISVDVTQHCSRHLQVVTLAQCDHTHLMICQSTVCVRGELRTGMKERLRHPGWLHLVKQTETLKKEWMN